MGTPWFPTLIGRPEACRYGPGTGSGHQVQDHRTGSGHPAHGHGTGSGSVDERISSVRHRCGPNRSQGRAAGCNSEGLVVCVEPDQRQFRHYGRHIPVWREILPFRWFQPAPHCPVNGDARQCGRAHAHFSSRAGTGLSRVAARGTSQRPISAVALGLLVYMAVTAGSSTQPRPKISQRSLLRRQLGDWQVSSPTRP